MIRVVHCRFASVSLCLLIVGCDRSPQARPGTPHVAAADPTAATNPQLPASTDSGSPCPRTGRWAICSLEKRLEQSGFVLRKVNGGNPRRLGFGVEPVVYSLGRARLEVFIYPDEAALIQDIARIDTMIVAPRGQKNDWEIPPRFIRSGNLVAVFLTRNEQQAERMTLAITAGAPQPGS